MFKGNKKNTWTTCSGIFIVNFEYFIHFSNVSIVDFEQVNVNWTVCECIKTSVSIKKPVSWFAYYGRIGREWVKDTNIMNSRNLSKSFQCKHKKGQLKPL